MHLTKITALMIILTIGGYFASPLPAKPLSPAERTFSHTLDNGLKVIVREDQRTPVVVSQVWYKVGSSYEPLGLTGVSHAVEHMMFKGTPKVPTGKFSRLIASYGGSENAFTSYDYTGYYQVMSANNLPLSLELEADRMQNALFPPREYEKEIEVIKEERRLRIDDNPNARTMERLNATAFLSGGYHHPIIGWMNDLDNLTNNDLKSWYKRWYTPGNATLVVVGAVDHKKVFELAETYFGVIPFRAVPESRIIREPVSLGERRLQVTVPAQVPAIYIGYNVPGINTAEKEWEVYALQMLASVLDGGYSARIETEIVRGQQIATTASARYGGFTRGDTLFILSGKPHAGFTTEDVEKAFNKQISKLQTELAKPEELERIKAQVISGIIYQQDSLSSQAYQIGHLESIGRSWKEGISLAENLKKITPEQIQAVAKKYLISKRKNVATLVPEKIQVSPPISG